MSLLTVQEVAVWLRMHPRSIDRLARAKKLPCYRIAGRWMFDREEILRSGRRPIA